MVQVKVPFLAEGVESGVVVSILVKEGDQIKKDQTLIELETNKATAPIPSTTSGKVTKVHVKEGAEVAVGQAVVSISETGSDETAAPQAVPTQIVKPAAQTAESRQPLTQQSTGEYKYESKSGFPPPASPTVRKLAEQIGIDLTRVKGSERGGRITVEDLKTYISALQSGSAKPAPQTSDKKPAPVSVDFSKWGSISKKPLSSLRRTIAQRMQESWSTIPHVTQFDEADITDLLVARKKYSAEYDKKGAKLTVTGIVLKGLVDILKKYPKFNSSLDEATNELVEKQYYHFGIAVDTEQGLIVPVLKEADKKNLLQLSIELAQLAEKTRQRKVSIEDMQGGTFTISNLGSIGGAHFTPIINKPEVAILGLGKGTFKPIVKDGKLQNRMMLPVCLSYDHRVVDGADGARFVQELVRMLENFDNKYFEVGATKQTKSITRKKKK